MSDTATRVPTVATPTPATDGHRAPMGATPPTPATDGHRAPMGATPPTPATGGHRAPMGATPPTPATGGHRAPMERHHRHPPRADTAPRWNDTTDTNH
ncbi:MAG: hypothetical protein IKQ52_09640 [Bacteroidales bacterium]|nr:hypothetical protein [Bacteroidales bacterium]MBR6905043.1 hypothetical protein [Bacteroidales bacterium]